MNTSTKIVHIHKKSRKTNRKKTNNTYSNPLDDYVPRFTENDVPKHDFFIDNSLFKAFRILYISIKKYCFIQLLICLCQKPV